MAKVVGYVNLYDSPSLGGLTKHRTPASTSFVGRFALIDFALSNFANSNINDIRRCLIHLIILVGVINCCVWKSIVFFLIYVMEKI